MDADEFEVFKERHEADRKPPNLKEKKRPNLRRKNKGSARVLGDKTNVMSRRNDGFLKPGKQVDKTQLSNDRKDRIQKKSTSGVTNLNLVRWIRDNKTRELANNHQGNSNANSSNKELVQTMRCSPGPTTGTQKGVYARFQEIQAEFSKIDPNKAVGIHQVMHMESLHVVSKFVNWFKNNKFDYILVDEKNKMTELHRLELEKQLANTPLTCKRLTQFPRKPYLNGMLSTLLNNEYIKPELAPTHFIQNVKKIGRFMYSVEAINIKNLEIRTNLQTQTCLLMATDIRFNLTANTLLVLNLAHCCYQKVGNEVLKIYLHWHVYSDKPIDVNIIK